jgi:hypothetical protein
MGTAHHFLALCRTVVDLRRDDASGAATGRPHTAPGGSRESLGIFGRPPRREDLVSQPRVLAALVLTTRACGPLPKLSSYVKAATMSAPTRASSYRSTDSSPGMSRAMDAYTSSPVSKITLPHDSFVLSKRVPDAHGIVLARRTGILPDHRPARGRTLLRHSPADGPRERGALLLWSRSVTLGGRTAAAGDVRSRGAAPDHPASRAATAEVVAVRTAPMPRRRTATGPPGRPPASRHRRPRRLAERVEDLMPHEHRASVVVLAQRSAPKSWSRSPSSRPPWVAATPLSAMCPAVCAASAMGPGPTARRQTR